MFALNPILADLVARPMSPAARAAVNDIVSRAERDNRVAVPRAVSQEMQHIGSSRQIELENEGKLTTYLDGSRRLVLVTSIYARLIKLVLESYPLDKPAKRVRRPTTRFTRKRRPPTPAELEGLQRGNAKRAEEARARREAKQSATEV
jgi:hypothetical protein